MGLRGILCPGMVPTRVGKFNFGRGFNSGARTHPSGSGSGIMGLGLERGRSVLQDR